MDIPRILYQFYPPLNRPVCGALAIVSYGVSLSSHITVLQVFLIHFLRAPYTYTIGTSLSFEVLGEHYRQTSPEEPLYCLLT